jgi:multidrug efflux pump subunit AcrA (membrane-fusion protein)
MTNITRRTRIVEPIAFTGALMLILCLPAACDKADVRAAASQDRPAATEPADEHGHDHGKAADKGAPAADEHGHAHGDEHTDEVVLTPQAIRANGIRIATAKAQVLSATIVAPARVAYNAEQMAHVGSVVRGRVTELKVRVGDPVNRGDSLLVIDSAELGEAQSDYLQKRTAVEIAHPAVELAKSSYQRADELYNTNQGIALTEVQKRQGEYQAAQGALRSAEAALTAALSRLTTTRESRPASKPV